MEELLAGVIEMIGEVLFEAVFEVVCFCLATLLTRAISKLFSIFSDLNPIATAFALGMLGALVGFLSVIAYPHPLVHPSRFHGVSVIVSPLITGFVISQLGRLLRNIGRKVTPIESFGYGFVFAFAMALVRFLMLK
jgi:uncharacterized membrane protein